MGSGLIVTVYLVGIGWKAAWGVYVWPPWQPCSCKPLAGHLWATSFLLTTASPSLLLSVPNPQESPGASPWNPWGVKGRAVPWGPGQPSPPQPPVVSPMSCPPSPLPLYSPQPLHHCCPPRQFPWNNHISGWLPPPYQTRCWEIPTSQAWEATLEEAGDLWEGPNPPSPCWGPNNTVPEWGKRSWGEQR